MLYIFSVPVEFFYLENISAFFGGYAVFYLGMYSFVTNVAKPKDRAHRLARLDGMELLGYIVGTFVSPVIYERVGSFGSYGLSAGFIFLAIAYLVAFVEEPIERKTEENKEKGQSSNWFVKALVTPFNGMKSLIVKKRKPFLKFLILLQFLCFFTYWVVIEAGFVTYLYMFQVNHYLALRVSC
jgi:MFS family permease